MATGSAIDTPDDPFYGLLLRTDMEDQLKIEKLICKYLRKMNKQECLDTLNKKNFFGNTALLELLSSDEPRSSTVSKLISFGADVNIPDGLDMTPVYRTVVMLCRDRFTKRNDKGQNLLLEDKEKIKKWRKNEHKILKHLIAAGASVNQPDIFGRSPLFQAKDVEVVNTLVKYGGDIKVFDKCGRSLLHNAVCLPNSLTLCQYFLEHLGSEFLNKPDNYGSTPAHYAIILGQDEVMEGLLVSGVDLHAIDADGNSLLKIWEERKKYWQAVRRTSKLFQYTEVVKPTIFIEFQSKPAREIEVNTFEHFSKPLERNHIQEEILQSPGIGQPFNTTESQTVTATVLELVQGICDKFAAIDQRMKCTLFRTGSSTEGTKTGDPTEFDFVFCIDELAELCEIKEFGERSGFVQLQCAGDIPEGFKYFFDGNKVLNAFFARVMFSRFLKIAVLDKTVWKFPELIFEGDIKHFLEFDRPVFTLKLRWIGRTYKNEEISVDIVPAVRIRGWWPSYTNLSSIPVMTDAIRNEGCLLLLQKPNNLPNTILTISCAPAEICLIKTLPDYFRTSYRLCKLLRHRTICPRMDPLSGTDDFPFLEASDSITSYMLKNALFHSLGNCRHKSLAKPTLADCKQNEKGVEKTLSHCGQDKALAKPTLADCKQDENGVEKTLFRCRHDKELSESNLARSEHAQGLIKKTPARSEHLQDFAETTLPLCKESRCKAETVSSFGDNQCHTGATLCLQDLDPAKRPLSTEDETNTIPVYSSHGKGLTEPDLAHLSYTKEFAEKTLSHCGPDQGLTEMTSAPCEPASVLDQPNLSHCGNDKDFSKSSPTFCGRDVIKAEPTFGQRVLAKADTDNEDDLVLQTAVQILRSLDRFIVDERLPMYLMPSRDIFSFDLAQRYRDNPRELFRLNHYHCTRRRAFLKMMLHLLGEKLVIE